jgi:hypothetical protein
VDRIYTQQLTVAAGVLPSAPISVAVPLEANMLVGIQVIIPAGHNGLTGLRFQVQDVSVLPWGNQPWLIGNDEKPDFPVNMYIEANYLKAFLYNTDIYAHSFFIRVTMTDYTPPATLNSANPMAPVVLPQTGSSQLDPLSPDALLASLPPDVAQSITDSSLAGVS